MPGIDPSHSPHLEARLEQVDGRLASLQTDMSEIKDKLADGRLTFRELDLRLTLLEKAEAHRTVLDERRVAEERQPHWAIQTVLTTLLNAGVIGILYAIVQHMAKTGGP